MTTLLKETITTFLMNIASHWPAERENGEFWCIICGATGDEFQRPCDPKCDFSGI